MSSIRVKLVGGEAYLKTLDRITPKKRPGIIRRALKRAGFRMQELATTKYITRGGGPAKPDRLTTRTGTLVRSIGVEERPTYVEVGTNVIYGRAHELGIPPMPPRPFLQPALDDVSREFPEMLLREWERDL